MKVTNVACITRSVPTDVEGLAVMQRAWKLGGRIKKDSAGTGGPETRVMTFTFPTQEAYGAFFFGKDTTATPTTDRVFISSAAEGWGPQNVPLTYAQIEAAEFADASPEVRATASTEGVRGGRWWVVTLDYGDYVKGDEYADLVGIFAGSEDDAKELIRLVRESAGDA